MAPKPIYQEIVEMGPFDGQRSPERDGPHVPAPAFGQAGHKPSVDLLDFLAVLISMACLVAAMCTIPPRLAVPWYLGYTSQIIVIGFLLSIMNLCLMRVSPALFTMMEARFGYSTLQNYEAILRNQPFSAEAVSFIWRTIMLFLIVLPLGLSAGYKRYTGGTARAMIPKDEIPSNMYGTAALPGLNGLGSAVGYAELINATLPFMSASQDDGSFPLSWPRPYGQNVLLLSNTSTALLDMPMPDLVTSIQQGLASNERRTLSSSVHAFVTTYNQSAEKYRNDTDYWNQYYFDLEYELDETTLFTGWTVYTLMNNYAFNDDDGNDSSWCFVDMTTNVSYFNQTALRFDTHRHSCQATWEISINSVFLLQASCDADPLPSINQEILNGQAIGYWFTDILADSIGIFSTGRPESPWRLPTYVTTVGAMYWARISALQGPMVGGRISQVANNSLAPYELYYPVHDQIMYSIKETLDPRWSLYAILILQPILSIVVLALKTLFHSVPIGEGFGLVAIIAGINKDSLGTLEGASLTGKLRRPLRLAIDVKEYPKQEAADKGSPNGPVQWTGRIEYVVGGRDRNKTLRKNQIYF